METVLISGFIVTIQHPVSQAMTHSHLGTKLNTPKKLKKNELLKLNHK